MPASCTRAGGWNWTAARGFVIAAEGFCPVVAEQGTWQACGGAQAAAVLLQPPSSLARALASPLLSAARCNAGVLVAAPAPVHGFKSFLT